MSAVATPRYDLSESGRSALAALLALHASGEAVDPPAVRLACEQAGAPLTEAAAVLAELERAGMTLSAPSGAPGARAAAAASRGTAAVSAKAAPAKKAAAKTAKTAKTAEPAEAVRPAAGKKAPAKKVPAKAVKADGGPAPDGAAVPGDPEAEGLDPAEIDARALAAVAQGAVEEVVIEEVVIEEVVVEGPAEAELAVEEEPEAKPEEAAKPEEEDAFVLSDDDDDAPAQQVATAGATADPVKDYLKQIGKVALLNAEQEVELAKRIEAGLFAEEKLNSDRRNWTDKMRSRALSGSPKMDVARRTTCSRPTFDSSSALAKRYTGRGMLFLDLIQEGNLGLISAVEKFDYTKGYKFSTYATWWIRQAITRAMADQARTIRIPVHMVEVINKLARVQRQMLQDLGREPTPEELAQANSI